MLINGINYNFTRAWFNVFYELIKLGIDVSYTKLPEDSLPPKLSLNKNEVFYI